MSIRQGNKVIAGHTECHFDLFDHKWSDHMLNDASWLRADTFSWQSGAVYQAAYQHLADDLGIAQQFYAWTSTYVPIVYGTLSETPSVGDKVYIIYNGTVTDSGSTVSGVVSSSIITIGSFNFERTPAEDTIAAVMPAPQTETIAGTTITYYTVPDGHKIVLADQESNVQAIYDATGVAWYYIIDTTNQRFKLPRTKFGFTGIRSGVGNYVEAGLPNITGNTHWIGAVFNNNNTSYANGVFSAFDSNNGAYAGGGGYGNAAGRLSFDASRSSSVYGSSSTVQPKATEMYLYFYVGNFTQTALENTAGLNAELFNGKADLSTVAHVVTEFQEPTSANNQTWYRKYADGWVEQGILFHNRANSSTWTFPIPMTEGGYDSQITNVSGDGPRFAFVRGRYATYLTYNAADDSSENNDGTYTIRVCGMAAN